MVLTTAWFEYGTDRHWHLSTHRARTGDPARQFLSFNATISLSAYNTYYFRAAASNSGGTQKGAIMSFQTGVLTSPSGQYYLRWGDDILADGKGYEPYWATSFEQSIYGRERGREWHHLCRWGGLNCHHLSNYPSAQYYLIMYGTNDSNIFFGPGSEGDL